MYNEKLKIQFIKSYTKSIHTANVAERVFTAVEKYENEWGCDLCTQSAEVLQPVLDEVSGLRTRSQRMSLTILREYVKWCIAMEVPNACDGMLHITTAGLDKIKKQMVSSPFHLQKCLDEVFLSESKETIDLTYRCYCWMAFSGLKESDTLLVTASDIDFNNMLILYGGKEYPLYREAVPAFRAAAGMSSFYYIHPHYETRRDRISGDTIMRGFKGGTNILTTRSTVTKMFSAALKKGETKQQLSFSRIWMSGLFYRIYENERAGLPVSFSQAAVEFMDGREYKLREGVTLAHKQNRLERNYLEDYERWKLAFFI